MLQIRIATGGLPDKFGVSSSARRGTAQRPKIVPQPICCGANLT
jgi:hypothetical protein